MPAAARVPANGCDGAGPLSHRCSRGFGSLPVNWTPTRSFLRHRNSAAVGEAVARNVQQELIRHARFRAHFQLGAADVLIADLAADLGIADPLMMVAPLSTRCRYSRRFSVCAVTASDGGPSPTSATFSLNSTMAGSTDRRPGDPARSADELRRRGPCLGARGRRSVPCRPAEGERRDVMRQVCHVRLLSHNAGSLAVRRAHRVVSENTQHFGMLNGVTTRRCDNGTEAQPQDAGRDRFEREEKAAQARSEGSVP